MATFLAAAMKCPAAAWKSLDFGGLDIHDSGAPMNSLQRREDLRQGCRRG